MRLLFHFLLLFISIRFLLSQTYISLKEGEEVFVASSSLHYEATIQPSSNSVKFYISSYIGSCSLKFETGVDYTQNDVHGQIIYTITSPQSQYHFDVIKTNNDVCSLMFLTDNSAQVLITDNVQKIFPISKQDGMVKFNYTNKVSEKKENIVFRIQSLECTSTFSINGTDYEASKYTQKSLSSTDELYSLDHIIFSVGVDSFDVSSSEYCTVLITVGELVNNITITEGAIHDLSFSKNMTSFGFHLRKVASSPYFSIDMPIENDIALRVDSFIKGELYQSQRIYKSTLFNLASVYEIKCSTFPCDIDVKLSVSSSISNELNINFIYRTNGATQPIYLDKNAAMGKGFLYSNNYYYMTIENNEEGEIYLYSKKGEGTIYAKIVSKGTIEQNANWNGRVLLPTSDKTNLQFDSVLNKVTYSYNKASGSCPCEVYINVKNENFGDGHGMLVNFEYLLYRRTSTDDITSIPLNEYISGNVNEVNQFNYYKVEIPSNLKTNRIIISLKSEFVSLSIKENSKPSSTDFTWNLPSEGYITISSSDISKESFASVTLIIGATIQSNYDSTYSSYRFRISPQYVNSPDVIIADSNEEEFYQTSFTQKYAYFLTTMTPYDEQNEKYFYAYASDNINKYLPIYLTTYRAAAVESALYSTELDVLFPTKEQYTYQNSITSYFIIKKTEAIYDEKLYVIIGVYTETPQMITLSTDSKKKFSNIKFDTVRGLYYIGSQMDLGIEAPFDISTCEYTIEVSAIRPNITMTSNFDSIKNRELLGNYYFNMNSKKIGGIIIRNDNSSDRFVSMRMIKKAMNTNVNEIQIGNSYIENYGTNIYQSAFYIKVPKDAVSFKILFTIPNVENFNKEFDMKCYIVSLETIKRYKLDRSIQIEGEEQSMTYLQNNTMSITINMDVYNKFYGKYLLVTIEKSSTSSITLTSSAISICSYEESYIETSPRYYHYNIIKGVKKNTYLLSPLTVNDNMIKIELAEEAKSSWLKNFAVFYAIEPYSDVLKYKNDTLLIKQSEENEYGKRSIIYQIDSSLKGKPLILSVYLEQIGTVEISDEVEMKYIIKYDMKSESFPSPTFNATFVQSLFRRKVKISFNEIFKDSSIISSCLYRVILYQYIPQSKAEDYDTIYYNNTFKIDEKEVKGTNQGKTIDTEIYLSSSGNYAINIIAEYKSKNNDENSTVAYTSQIVTEPAVTIESTPQNKFQFYTLTNIDTKLYSIERNANEEYIFIEFNSATKTKFDIEAKLRIAFQGYTEQSVVPSYMNETSQIQIDKEDFDYGRSLIILKTSLKKLLITFYTDGTNDITDFAMKYYSADSRDKEHRYTFNNTISSLNDTNNRLYVQFKEMFENSAQVQSMKYAVSLYKKDTITEQYLMNTIVINKTLVYQTKEVDGKNNGENVGTSFTVDDTDSVYIAVLAIFTMKDGREERISYGYSKTDPVAFDINNSKTYITSVIDSQHCPISFVINSNDTSNRVYEIDISQSNLNNTLVVAYEYYSSSPSYTNSSSIKEIVSNGIYSNYRRLFYIETDFDFPITLSIKTANSTVSQATKISFKYKAINKVSDIKTFYINKDFTVRLSSSKTLQVKWTEVFNNTDDIDNSTYIVSIYQKEKYKDDWELQSIEIDDDVENFNVQGKNIGGLRTEDFIFTKEYKEMYVRLMVRYVTKDKDERRDLIGVIELKSSNAVAWIILIVVTVALLIGGIIYFKVIRKKDSDDTYKKIMDIQEMKSDTKV